MGRGGEVREGKRMEKELGRYTRPLNVYFSQSVKREGGREEREGRRTKKYEGECV